MNDRYLYRAKHVHVLQGIEHLEGRWIEGYLSDENHINSPKLEGEFLIDPSTICQCTGLKDKNGKLIWENDVVRKVDTNALGYHRERICMVSFDNSGYWKIMTTLGDGYWIGEFEKEQLEVIGNKFDNPELLEVEE